MAQRVVENCVVEITPFQKLKIQLLSVFVGLFIVLKRFFRSFWKAEPTSTESRDRPQSCLIDNTLGQHSYIKLKRVKLHYVEDGPKDSQLALLLHGFPDCWLGWRHQIKVLANHYRVVAVDLKGFGDSDKPMWRTRYKLQTILQELQELVQLLGHKRCVLIGHDLGAQISWYLASQYPAMVRKLVVIACPHPNVLWDYLPPGSTFNSRWIQLCQLPLLPEMEARKDDIALVDECYKHLVRTREEKLAAAYKYVFSRPEDWTGAINYFRNLPFCRVRSGVTVAAPTLLIVGNRDPLIQLESVVRSTEFAGKFVLKIVEGAGHFPHQEDPVRVNRLLLSFLTVAPSAPAEKTDAPAKGLIGSLYCNTVKYGNSLVDNVKKSTNGVAWLPSHMLKHPS